jgi:DNA-binding transcriptional ArsR family regulator
MTNRLAAAALSSLADPTRREIFERLASRPMAVGALARDLPVTRPAVSQHLRVLKEAGLVTDEAEGTRRIYRIDPAGIGAIRAWLDGLWAEQLGAFKAFADQIAREENKQ